MSVARQCANCGTIVNPGQQYCGGCGAAFVTTMVKRRRPFYQVLLISGGVFLALCVGISVFFTAINAGADSPSPSSSSSVSSTPAPTPNKVLATMIDPRLLASNPREYIGDNVYIQGKALTVTQHGDYTWVQILAIVPGKGTTESVIVEMRPKYTLLTDECYRIYGIGAGTQSVTRTLTGASGEAPLLNGYLASESSSDQYGGCAGPR
jgi:hypothetical protein